MDIHKFLYTVIYAYINTQKTASKMSANNSFLRERNNWQKMRLFNGGVILRDVWKCLTGQNCWMNSHISKVHLKTSKNWQCMISFFIFFFYLDQHFILFPALTMFQSLYPLAYFRYLLYLVNFSQFQAKQFI